MLYASMSVISLGPKNIDFMKIYDGSGGVNHSVHYEGELVTNRFVNGTWKIMQKDGSFYSGYFEMHR